MMHPQEIAKFKYRSVLLLSVSATGGVLYVLKDTHYVHDRIV